MSLTPAEDWGRFSAYSEIIKDAERRTEDRIVTLLDGHQLTNKTTAGFLGGCSCGEFIDDYRGHLIALIKGEQK